MTVSVPEATEAFESFLVDEEGHKRDSELRDREIEEHEREQVIHGKMKEFDKLLKTGAFKINTGREAQQVCRMPPKSASLTADLSRRDEHHLTILVRLKYVQVGC